MKTSALRKTNVFYINMHGVHCADGTCVNNY